MHHTNMEVWKSSMDLVLKVYELTNDFPKDELYGLTSQIRRCAVSIPSNIAEGCGRFSDKETYRFISIALGSVAELETQLIIAERLKYINNPNEIYVLLKRVNALLIGLKKRLENDEIDR